MAETGGNDSSEIESITSSQKSFLKNCPFANPGASPTKSTDSVSTEVLGNQISPAVVKTPILSFSSPTSLDSINDDVFRTPPENASLSSAADSEPRARVSVIQPRRDSNLTSPFSNAETMPLSSSSSPPAENFRDLEIDSTRGGSNLKSPSPTVETTPVSASLTEKVRVSEIDSTRGGSNLTSPSPTAETTPVSASPSGNVRVSEIDSTRGRSNLKSPSSAAETTPVSASPSENVRVLDPSDSVSSLGVLKPDLVPLSSPPSVVRVPVKLPNPDSSSPTANQPVSDVVANNGVSKSPVTEDSGGDLPFKEIIEALLRNSGENLNERDENVSFVDILKQCGLKFP